ncbi:MAG: protoporphyrinogen oxidase, partial [Pseudomonadota bacterium]|nr:protoporphyrinogen oxidase [Pseudomonadota bacterium]
MSVDCDVLVLGGGLSGLVTAFRLQRAGRDVCLVEGTSRTGGVIGSREHEGALFETGPNSTLDSTQLLGGLIDELGIGNQRIEADARAKRRFIVRNGGLVALPNSPRALLTSRALPVSAKLRLLREPFIAAMPADLDESVASFIERRLGSIVLDYVVEPFVAGIYAGDPDTLSMRAAFPRLYALEQNHGSLIKGAIKRRSEKPRGGEGAKPAGASFSFARGMQTLTDALAQQLSRVCRNTRALAIERLPDGAFRVLTSSDGPEASVRARNVVISTPAFAAASLVGGVAPDAADVLASIDYPALASVASVYERRHVAHALDGFGFLVPRLERRQILGSLFSSSMFPGRSREDETLITTFVGGVRDPSVAALDDDDLAAIVSRELAALLGAAHPRWQHVTRWPHAIPQYTIGHLER